MTARVVVVGSVNLDHTVRVPHLPAHGETVRASGESVGGGGKGANAAMACALTGARTSLVGCVGSDEAAGIALAELIDLGIDISSVVATSAPTGAATVLVDGDGGNCIVVVGGANDLLTPRLVVEAFERVEDAAVILANLEIPDESVLAAAEVAAARGALLIVNPAPARTLPGRLLGLRPMLTPNADEVRRLTGADAEAGAVLLQEQTGAPVIVTLGVDGALLVHRGGLVKIPALRVHVADTTGAGDVFMGRWPANSHWGQVWRLPHDVR